jgi:hypothetical protein
MPESTGDERARQQREAVEREIHRRREPDERDLVEAVGEEQRRIEEEERRRQGEGERERGP